ncbi:MAG: 16S rRNA (guanine(527)-N(7))-methyltransferase RsmG, partial [Lentilitoribacter sp.]
NVSRETYDLLNVYASLLEKWNPRINLVSKSTLDDLWSRHIVDSAQLFELAPQDVDHWVDLGSGGGFPGMVIAILAKELRPDMKVTLVESDQRKCAFLRTVSRETNCNATVHSKRIEALEPQNADILSARALADLNMLLGFAERHLKSSGICLFPKGLTWEKELKTAQDSWQFSHQVNTSEINADSVVLRIEEIKHA